jgi:hypothetical protein
MWVKILALFMMWVLAACESTVQISAPEPPILSQDTRVSATLTGVEVTVHRPDGWQAYIDEDGIALAETPASVVDGAALHGLLLYLWIPRMDEFVLPVAAGQNLAHIVLNQVIMRPDYVGESRVTEPQPFQWDNQRAAYYLLNNAQTEQVSMVLAVTAPRSSRLLVSSISVPSAEAERVRLMLPVLFEGLTINGVQLDAAALNELPQTLNFPE